MTASAAVVGSPLRTFILKVANRCNIDCDYCYVFNSHDDAWRHLPARMSLDTAMATATRIAEHARAYGIREVDVVLHGGEPLLAGPRLLDQILSGVRKVLLPDVTVRFGLQTNATLLNKAWLDLLEQHRVVVGVSLDGPPEVNDLHRLSHRHRPTTNAVLRGLGLLRCRPKLFGGLLAVVDMSTDPVAVHDYLASFEPPMIDFNLPHTTHDDPPIRHDPNVPEYGIWLANVYDRWISRPEYSHSVRMLEDIIALNAGVSGSVETLGLAAPGIVIVESDGTIESIDTLRAVETGASALGIDVFTAAFDAALSHPKIQLRNAGIAALADECQRCSLVEICGGGYLPHRFGTLNGYRNPSVYCADLMYLIRHVQDSLRENGWTPNAIHDPYS